MPTKLSQAERIAAYRDAPRLAETLKKAIEEDSKGVPEKRLVAVRAAAGLMALNLGARTAAELMGYDKGSNVAQPYFDVAKGIAENLIPEGDVKKQGIRALADTVRRIRKENRPPDDTPLQDQANGAFKRLRKTVEKHALVYDVRAALMVWFSEKRVVGNVALVSSPTSEAIRNVLDEVKASMAAHAEAAPEAVPVVEETAEPVTA